MDMALAILGFYFTLIGFIGGLFFTRLDSWYGQVREFSGSYSGEEPETKNTPVNCRKFRIKIMGLRESAPQGSFIAVGCLTTALALLSWAVPFASPQVNPVIFLRVPLILTIFMYWSGGILLLRKGNTLLEKIDKELEKIIGRPMAS
jgi:hypothetical protein